MNLEQRKTNAKDIKALADKLIANYKESIVNLNAIRSIIAKYDFGYAEKINNLINRYNEMIRDVSSICRSSADCIINYIDNFSQNLNDLEKDIANTNEKLSGFIGNSLL